MDCDNSGVDYSMDCDNFCDRFLCDSQYIVQLLVIDCDSVVVRVVVVFVLLLFYCDFYMNFYMNLLYY